ncbi:serine/threonine protein kinase domain protein [Blumeria hordei DH14]|uniref:DNA topoisomerase 2 n=1 Tax=Blumeria graminis f. sp. hordei (strain DH14) TaxID=546991 RepID=N1JKN9_BLUG1|nr:serine/threonine protein kinase domain protein [Blumeria hordei DH14]
MDDSMDDSVFDNKDDSEDFAPPSKPKVKPVAKKPLAPKATKISKAPKVTRAPKVAKAPPKKMVQTSLKSVKPITKKRPSVHDQEDDDEDNNAETDSNNSAQNERRLPDSPPSAKKQKKGDHPSCTNSPSDIEDNDISADTPPVQKAKKKKDATDQYQKLTQLEHIIKRPDTYIGSVERTEQTMWVFNSETNQMEFRKVQFVPGLYKIFDEILVNAADHKQVDPNMKQIKVIIDREKGEISVENDGRGIPVEIHKKEKVYIPEMIFGHLLTGSNYDDDEEKTTGGRNGYGAKLCNIFSTQFTLETQDSTNVKRYKQTWTDNMGKMDKAKITTSKTSDFTRVTFTPDYKRFKMEGIDDDFEALMKRRVYDMAGTVKKVKVFLNGTQIKMDFKKYMEMYAKAINRERGLEGPENDKVTVIVENNETHEKWEVGFAVSDGSFQQVSFVNSIATTSGGTHVNYIADQICEKLMEVVKKKNAKGAVLKTNQIRNHIFLFVNCLIVNPAFTSQTKEQLTTRPKQFGSKCILSDKFLKDIAKTDAVQNILNFAQAKADQVLAKSDGNRRSRMNNPKLVDANLAGTKRGHECTLILTEGDSAKGLAVAGRAILDPDRIGVFPLRGKLLNVRDATIEQISKNAEIQNIKQFLGLKHKQVYKETTGLRYGHLMIMADQDHDGSHIKGLLINFLQVQFPSLLKLPDFFREFITPIVKVWKGPNPKKPIGQRSFFTLPEYEEWRERHTNDKGWRHKYFKGLGTSLPEDAQVYFSNLDDHLREFETIKPEEEDLIDLAFSKKKADARKQWLGNFIPGTFLDHSTRTLTYDNFVNKELILFSMADNLRSIPSVIDGFKPGQRKVMYACFKRNLIRDMKVVELAGYVSENTAYHHGEASMHQTIIGLAQNFVGSNNINCLEPSGSFGSRLAGGSDAASPRYIFTRLSPFARRVFSPLDGPLYEHNVDDGRAIEPTMYCPVVPMVLVNGADGIGTGWSTTIPNYHPIDIVNNLKRRMGRAEGVSEEEPFSTMTPWFRGWKGTPQVAGPMRYNFDGIVRCVSDNEVEITELPIRMWTDDFKAKLEEIIKGEKAPSFIKDYKEYNDHKSVHFIVQIDDKHIKPDMEDGLLEKFKLHKTVATSNLVAFDTRGQIRKYEKVEDILEEYYVYRLAMYTKRKAYWLEKINTEYTKLRNQARFVLEIIDNKLIISKKKKPVLVAELRQLGYDAFPKVKDAQKSGEAEEVVDNDDDDADEESGAKDFDYLLGLPLWSLTQERVDKLKAQMMSKKQEHDDLEKLSEKDLWCQDLDELVKEWENQLKEEEDYQKSVRNTNRRASRKIGAGGKNARVRVRKDDAEYNPKPSKSNTSKATATQQKTHQKFIENFTKPKKGKSTGSDDVKSNNSDDEFDAGALLASKNALKEPSQPPVVKPSRLTSKRAKPVASTKRSSVEKIEDESASSDYSFVDDIGDIGNLVKGIEGDEKNATSSSSGRMSLFASQRSGSRGPSNVLPQLKSKPSRGFIDDDDGEDDTNYEMLARSSPQKSGVTKDILDSYLSDDDTVPITQQVPVRQVSKAAQKSKKIGTAPSRIDKTQINPVVPATKAKAKSTTTTTTKRNKQPIVPADIFSDDEDVEMNNSPPPKPISRARQKAVASKQATSDNETHNLNQARPSKTVARKKEVKSTKQISDDEDDLDMDLSLAPLKVSMTKKVLSDEEDESIIPLRTARGRSARVASNSKPKKPIYVDSEEEETEDEQNATSMEDDFDETE